MHLIVCEHTQISVHRKNSKCSNGILHFQSSREWKMKIALTWPMLIIRSLREKWAIREFGASVITQNQPAWIHPNNVHWFDLKLCQWANIHSATSFGNILCDMQNDQTVPQKSSKEIFRSSLVYSGFCLFPVHKWETQLWHAAGRHGWRLYHIWDLTCIYASLDLSLFFTLALTVVTAVHHGRGRSPWYSMVHQHRGYDTPTRPLKRNDQIFLSALKVGFANWKCNPVAAKLLLTIK